MNNKTGQPPYLRWVPCGRDPFGLARGPMPSEPGYYRVVIEGDSESEDGFTLYSYPDYETWAEISFDEGDGSIIFIASHDEEAESMIAWYGPIEVPKCTLFKREKGK